MKQAKLQAELLAKANRLLLPPSTLAVMLAGCGGSSGPSATVVPVNNAPQVGADTTITIAEDSGVEAFAVSAPTDPNNDTLVVTIDALPADGTVFLSSDPNTPLALDSSITAGQVAQLSFRPDFGFDGDAGAFAYTVSDQRGGTASQSISFDVENLFSDSIANALVEGATVFLDMDGDGILDAGEPSTITDENGRYTLLEGSGALVSTGGVDGLTGLRLDFQSFVTAEGGSVASPLNTLLFYADDPADVLAKTKLQSLIDEAGGVDLGTFDASARSSIGGGDLAGEVMQLNQEVFLAVTALRTLYTLVDEPDPEAAAYRALASSLEQTPEDDEIGITLSLDFSADAVREIAQDLTGIPDFISSTLDGIVDFVSGEILSFVDFGLDLLEIDPIGFFSPLRRAVMEKYTVDAEDLLKNLRDPGEYGAILEGLFSIREQLTLGLDDILLRQLTFGDNIQFSPRQVADGTVIELEGTELRDELNGGDGVDILRGNAGGDALYAGAGQDSSFGGDGDDLIIDILSNVVADGGAGDDVIAIWEDSQSAIGGEGIDTLDLQIAADSLGLTGPLNDLVEGAADFRFEIDVDAGTLTTIAEGEMLLDAASIAQFESYVLPGDADVVFVGGDGDDALSVDLSAADGIGQLIYTATNGDDSVTSRIVEASGGAEDVFDLSGLTTAVTFAGVDAPLVAHTGGSLTLTGVIGSFLGTNNGDTVHTQPLAAFVGLVADGTEALTVSYTLGAGADTLVLNDAATDFAIAGFDAASDAVDLSGVERLAGEAFSEANFDMALTAIDVDGTPSTQLTYDDDGTSAASLVLEGVTPGELTADVFLFAVAEV